MFNNYDVETKPVILIAAFGSTYQSGIKNLEDFDRAVREAFPENEVRWGFTASIVVNKLKKEGIDTLFESRVPVMMVKDALFQLAAEGKTRVVVVNFLLMIGQKYRQVLNASTKGLNVKYVHPLLFYPENVRKIVSAIEVEFGKEDQATIVCAHGNERFPEYNGELIKLDEYLKEKYSNTYLTVIEGEPSFDKVMQMVINSGVKRAKFISFMLTYGDHMSNDVMGDHEDSMKTLLSLPAECTDGLASSPSVQKLFIDKIKKMEEQF